MRFRIAIFGSHPIPYRSPMYRKLAARDDVQIEVIYGDDYGVRPRPSKWGMKDFRWSGDVVSGYPHVFLRNLAPSPDPQTFFGRLNPGLAARLAGFEPRAAVIMGYKSAYSLQALAASFALGVPVCYVAEDQHTAPFHSRFGKQKEIFLRHLYPRIAAFLAVGERNKNHYRSLGVSDEKLFSFPYSVDNDEFRRQEASLRPDRQELRRRWNIRADAPCVVFAGRLVDVKNVAELIRGAAAVDGLHVLIVGSGPERDSLGDLASSLLPGRHTFAGFLNQDQLGEAYVAADLFALTSSFEPWGLVCNEAMNFGLPLVLADSVGASEDLIVDGETGWRYPVGNVGDLSRALRAAVHALEDRREQLRAAALRRVDNFSFDAQAEGVVAAARYAAGES